MKINDNAQIKYENDFNNKIDYFKNHPKYPWLRQYANDALNFHTGFGFLTIKAIDFMDRINSMDIEYIQDWLDGKNNLEWK
jgi:hypothetical protein